MREELASISDTTAVSATTTLSGTQINLTDNMLKISFKKRQAVIFGPGFITLICGMEVDFCIVSEPSAQRLSTALKLASPSLASKNFFLSRGSSPLPRFKDIHGAFAGQLKSLSAFSFFVLSVVQGLSRFICGHFKTPLLCRDYCNMFSTIFVSIGT